MSPIRLRRSRAKGYRIPEDAVNVTRPTIWGNPFTHDDPAVAVAAYRGLITSTQRLFEMGPGRLQFARNAHRNTLHPAFPDYVRDHIHHLRGKNLVCWCAIDGPCHADVLLDMANRETPCP